MSIKAFVTAALVLGSTSLAMADAPQPSAEIRDHRPIDQAPIVASWGHPPIFHTLSTGDRIDRSGSEYIRVRSAMPLKTLKLQATSGKTFVDLVKIKFANGRTQTVDLDKRLESGCDATIDLAGNYRNVVSITVTGKAQGRRATFAVLGA